MTSRCPSRTLLSLLIIAAVFAGCAKRPATTQASAPAPTGAAGAMGAPGRAGTTSSMGPGGAAGSGAQAGMQPGGAGQPGQPGAGGVPGSTAMAPGGGAGPGAGPGMGGGTGTGPGAGLAPGGAGAPGAGGAGQPGSATTTPGARPMPKEFAAIAQLRDIYFDFDKYDIRPNDARILDENAAWLKSNPDHLVLIEGHCDERGTNEYNLALGERRAKSTMNYLVSQGVQAGRITIISYGEERPGCTEHDEGCWSKNRRAHFLVKPR
jgi:peptidoglycan-associated lipoprotein